MSMHKLRLTQKQEEYLDTTLYVKNPMNRFVCVFAVSISSNLKKC